jgi:hypothetical protein
MELFDDPEEKKEEVDNVLTWWNRYVDILSLLSNLYLPHL